MLKFGVRPKTATKLSTKTKAKTKASSSAELNLSNLVLD